MVVKKDGVSKMLKELLKKYEHDFGITNYILNNFTEVFREVDNLITTKEYESAISSCKALMELVSQRTLPQFSFNTVNVPILIELVGITVSLHLKLNQVDKATGLVLRFTNYLRTLLGDCWYQQTTLTSLSPVLDLITNYYKERDRKESREKIAKKLKPVLRLRRNHLKTNKR